MAYNCTKPASYDSFVMLCNISIYIALKALGYLEFSVKHFIVLKLAPVQKPLLNKQVRLLWLYNP